MHWNRRFSNTSKSDLALFNITLCDFKPEEKCCSVVQKRRRSFSWTDAVGCWRELLCVFYYAVSPYRLIWMHMKLIWMHLGLTLRSYCPIWTHIRSTGAHIGPRWVPYGFTLRQSWVHMDSYRVHFWIDMYPYGIIWSHIGVLWIHVGYLLGPYGSTAPHWIHRNPCLTDVVSIWISCWIQFCLYAQVLGTCQQHMEPHWAHI